MSTASHYKKPLGFTIIEVLIVLAVAGLIIMTVFVALPQLQRNSRNNQRAADASKILSAVNECIVNNNGILGNGNCLPTGAANSSISSGGPILSANGGTLDVTKLQQITTINIYTPSSTAVAPTGANATVTANVFGGYTCSGTSPTNTNVGSNQYIVLYERESGTSTPSDACLASQ